MPVEKFERFFLGLTIAMLILFFIAVGASAFAGGLTLPGPAGHVDPQALGETPPFDNPGVRQVGPNQYEVAMIAQTWAFIPNEVRVPAGSTVTFRVTTRDVIHGFEVTDTGVNIMLIPGQVSVARATFDEPGEHLFICHEYCGVGHHTMFGRVIVEPAQQAQAQ